MAHALELTLQQETDIPRQARRALAEFLVANDVPPQPEAGLVIAEAVFLAAMRGSEAIVLRLRLVEDRLRGTVASGGRKAGTLVGSWGSVAAPDLAELFMEKLTDRWGVEEESGEVWFEIALAA